MYSFCVNLYKYVNSTGIADGLFDWLLKCCYTTTLAWKTTLSQRWRRAKYWNRKQDFWGRRGHKDLKDGEEQCFFSEKESELWGKLGETKKRANVRQRSEEPSCYWEKSGNSPIWKKKNNENCNFSALYFITVVQHRYILFTLRVGFPGWDGPEILHRLVVLMSSPLPGGIN